MNPIITELRKRKPNIWKAYIQGNPSIFEEGENETVAIARLLMRLQGKKVRTWSGAFYLSLFCWLSVVILPWLILTGHLPLSAEVWEFWGFFLLLGVCAGAYSSVK